MRLRLLCLLIPAMAVIATGGYALSPAPPPPVPEEELTIARLPRDADRLIAYLKRGFPTDHVFPARSSYGTPSPALLRLHCYPFVIPALANLGDPRALDVLRRIQAGELPDVVQADIDLGVAARTQFPSLADWNTVCALERDRLRMEATLAIARLTGEPVDGLFLQLLTEWAARSAVEKEDSAIRLAISASMFQMCDSLLYADVAMGIETLLSLLESPSPDLQWGAGGYLYRLTSREFGPYHDTPAGVAKRNAQQWRDWWSTQQPVATDLGKFVRAAHESKVDLEPITLRDYLVEAVDHALTEWAPGNHPEDWLRSYAPKHRAELLAIAQDPEERLNIRAEALEYIVRFHPKVSYKSVLEALNDTTVAPSNALHDEAVELLYKNHQDKFDETINACIDNDCPSATEAIVHLWINGGRYTLAVKLSSMKPSLREYALDKLLWDHGPPVEALELALAGDNPEFAARALKAARHPAIKALLSQEALAHLAKWEQDAWCRYWLLVRTPRSEVQSDEYAKAIAAQRDGAAPAAAVHAIVFSRTDEPSALMDFAHCVDAYRLSRGAARPLSELGYTYLNRPEVTSANTP